MNMKSWFNWRPYMSEAEQEYEEDMKYFAAVCRIFHRAGFKVVRSSNYPDPSYRWFAVQLATPEVVIVRDFPFHCFKEFDFAETVPQIKVPVTEGEVFFAPAAFAEVNH